MDEKTEKLREIFVETTDEETITESQRADRGSLTESERDTNERLESVIAEMRETYEFDTDLDGEALRTVVRGFYAGRSDTDLADGLGVSRHAVFRARMALHLVRDADTDAPFDLSEFRNRLVSDQSASDLADDLGVAASTIRRYRTVVETQNRARRVSHRYRAAFEDALPDTALSAHLTADIQEDGLDDATEGIETDVSF
jgi:FixJ family two-component response regulator